MSGAQESEKTFRGYSQAQGAKYAQYRRNYHTKLYESILSFHKSGGGEFDILVDIGCGPGTATHTLAPNFKTTYGLDPSEGMISAARSVDQNSSTGDNVIFEVSTAESLGSDLKDPIIDGTVDLITAATCAHWFDMQGFWQQAAKALKTGGTVALWTGGTIRVDTSLPNHEAIQAVIDELDVTLEDYLLPGNILVRDLYRELALPWTLPSPVSAFDPDSFVRKEWNTGPDAETQFYEKQPPMSLDVLEMALGTGSPVTRWREDHPEAVGTEDDVVRQLRRKIEKILSEAGEEEGKDMVTGDVTGVLLLFRKKDAKISEWRVKVV
ncbi:hypothetical protein FAVG1_13010 [Fusarium avenaceum]|nr:hypothetical protein FAVG1_13010 [Fusarium avenaceum]